MSGGCTLCSGDNQSSQCLQPCHFNGVCRSEGSNGPTILNASEASSKIKRQGLKDRLAKWKEVDFDSRLHECRTIQNQLNPSQHRSRDDKSVARAFEKLVAVGNVKAAMSLITEQCSTGSLSLDNRQADGRLVKDHLIEKHPLGKPAPPSAISRSLSTTEPHPIVYERIDGPTIQCMT